MWGTNDDVFMARNSAFNPYRLRDRDMGFPTPIGAGDAMAKSLYCGMKPISCWSSESSGTPTGGIFNLEFSPEGSLLVAACEKRTIQIFDPLTHKRTHCMIGAHLDCINCVKFLDNRMFATCSDDTTIALWDIRNLSKKIRSLVGHSKWVKNIEYSQKDKLLVTSGLDGSIYTWAINTYTEYNIVYQRVFHTSSLMRCRLSPDANQMVLSTTGGLIILIHNLNLNTLEHDLAGFKPNLYRLMQMSQQVIPFSAKFDYLFDLDRKENRLEFITDFPGGNDAEVVSSLQIHPQGWTALSRNISHDDHSEWTCIHDIQPLDPRDSKSTRDSSPPPAPPRRAPPRTRGAPRTARRRAPAWVSSGGVRRSLRIERAEQARAGSLARPDSPPRRASLAQAHGSTRISLRLHGTPEGERPREESSQDSRQPQAEMRAGSGEASGAGSGAAGRAPVAGPSSELTRNAAADAAASRLGRGIQNDIWEASITIKQHRILQDVYRRGSVRRSFNMQRITGINTGITPPPAPHPAANPSADRPSLSGQTPERLAVQELDISPQNRPQIRQNKDRLLYYIEETNQGKGFIKELCYSADGRVVCSPFGRGIRLLALDENCSEIPSVIQSFRGPSEMQEIGQSLGMHQDLVVCSKFNPRFHMLVSGCLEGKIVWYQPYSGESMY